MEFQVEGELGDSPYQTEGCEMRIERQILGLAGEFAVASELCRRNVYAQLTLGIRKRTDILIETENGMLRIQVKSKQQRDWPNCKGIYGKKIVLVFVDFENKKEDERPDFYVLTVKDWKSLVNRELDSRISAGEVKVNEKNIPIWVKKVGKDRKPYEGMGVRPEQIKEYKERWDKITKMVR